jgi:hypothetical protein
MNCPGCLRVLKGKAELTGKTIRCPSCATMFLFQPLPEPADELAAGLGDDGLNADKVAPGAPPQPAATAGGDVEQKYDVTNLDLAARCPNCANPLESENAVVCLYCGYNTMTRTWGKTRKVVEFATEDWIKHLMPGFLALAFIILNIIGLLYLCLVVPYTVDKDSWMAFLNSEPIRLWSTIINLGLLWAAGFFCYQRFILNPSPPEKEKKK